MTPAHTRSLGLATGLAALLACSACSKPDQVVQETTAKPLTAAPNGRGAAAEPAADAQLAKGRELYARICAVCHGAAGEGYKADNAPALNHPSFLGSASNAFLRESIANGRSGSTMSAWSQQRGGPLDLAGIEAVIALMRSWYKGPQFELDEHPLAGNPPPDAKRGAALYAQHCARCHGARGIEGPNARIGDPALLMNAGNGFLRLAIKDGRPPTPMAAFGAALGAQGIDDVLAHLRALGAANAPQKVAGPTPERPLPLPPLPRNPNGPEPKGFLKHPAVTPLEVVARELKRGARLAILDARAPSDYLREHIAGAGSVPYYDPSPYFDKLPKNTWLVAYCACPHAESQTLAQKLLDAGFPKVTVLDEGIGAWKAKGHEVASAPGQPAPAKPQ